MAGDPAGGVGRGNGAFGPVCAVWLGLDDGSLGAPLLGELSGRLTWCGGGKGE